MASEVNPKVPIKLDKKRHLLLDLNAMVAFEDVTGINMMRGFDASKMTVKEFRAFLWACLIHEDKDLTLDTVGGMIHTANMDTITSCLIEAWNVAIPEAGEEAEDPLADKSPAG